MTATPIVTSLSAEQCLAKNLATSEQMPWNGWNPMPSIEEFRYLEFEPCNQPLNNSWTPKAAFDARESGGIGDPIGRETLYQFLLNLDFTGTAATTLLKISRNKLPNAEALITVYRATDATCESNYGSILPGASVTTSKAYAKRNAALYLNVHCRIMKLRVYPDELVTHRIPHEFIYAPRSLADGYQRFLRNVKTNYQKFDFSEEIEAFVVHVRAIPNK